MERLRFVLFIAAGIATASVSTAQLSVTPGRNGQQNPVPASFIVIGDVKDFNYFALSPTQQTTVRDAVLNAGLWTESASVSVLRGTQEQMLWTQTVSINSADSGELVVNGDVLVVKSMTPITEMTQKNAALRTGDGVTIVALEDESITIGDVLQQTDSMPASGHQLRFVHRFQGSGPIINAHFSDRVAHGDVVAISRGSRSLQAGPGQMSPAFSEWKEKTPVAPVALASDSEAGSATLQGVVSEAPLHGPGGFPLQVPQLPVVADFEPERQLEFPSQATDPFAAVILEEVDSPLAVRAVSQMSLDENRTLENSEIAPIPPVEEPLVEDQLTTTSEISPWNLVFIGGLLIAGTLILAGSLRADDDAEADSAPRTSNRNQLPGADVRHSDLSDIRKAPATSDVTGSTYNSVRLTVADKDVRTTARAENSASSLHHEIGAQQKSTPTNPVAPGEWFGGEWLKTGWETVDSGTVASDRPATASSTAIPGVSFGRTETVAQAIPGANTAPPVTDRRPQPESNGQFADLEDLIRNRLPIDLCQTRLPLRVSLFGRAAGPRRLRIDPLHSTLAGPHTRVAAEHAREDANVAAESQSGDPLFGAASGFHRTFQSLQERIDS